nr:MAG TPA: Large polyvalent protein associated domain 38 [Caudoviricetes sp.]
MDFFQRIGNFFSGKGWVSDEEKRRKEQQAQPQNKPAVTFKQDPVLNNLNKAPSFGSPSPTQGLFQQKPETPKTDTVPKVNTVPTANQFTKPVIPEIKPEIPQKTINDAPKVLTPQGQQDWVNKENKQIQNQNLANKPMITPKNPTYFDYLNPFGEHGLFGAKQQQNFKQTVEKPITDNINKFNNWIDSSDKEKGFQWSDPGDYLRFAAKIPGGMVQGLAETPNKVANAVTGIEADENGKVKQLNGVQRFGKGLDAGISVGGLGFGGSGTLLRSLAGLGKAGTKQAVKQGIGRTVLNGTKNLVKDSLKEGAEEVTQTFAQDLADDGKINTDKNVYFQSGAFGALGGGMMHGAGRAVNGVKGMVGNRINPYGESGVGINRLSPAQMKYNAAEVVGGITGDTRKRLSQAAFGDLQKARTGNPYRTSDGMDVELSRNGNRKMTATSQKTPSEMFNVQQRLAPKIQEAIEKSKQIDSNIDTKEHGFANDGFSYNEVPVRYRGKDYVTTFDIGSNNNKNLLYNATTRKSPMEPAGTNPSTELHHLGDSHVDSVAQEAQNVNEDVKYKLNPEHEAQVRAYNEHITRLRQREEYLRGQGMSENAPAMINLRKAQEQAIYARDHIGEVDENGLKYKLSPEQETFFKDSKIRDENGNLKTVYHGTNSEFDQFSPLAGSSSSTRNRWGEGNYLAYDKDMANGYGVNLKEMYANITSPITNNQKTVSFDQYDALHRRVNNGEPAYREDYDMYDNDMDLLWDITDNGQWKKYAQDIKDTTGKDGVIMDDMAITFSPNQTKYTDNLNPTDSPDMRYKRQAEAKIQEIQQSKELLARHLQLTGDENLVFNEWQNEMQKRALGYYDPKTDQINLNKLTEDTLNHELGHKLLTRVENKQDLLNSIRESYGDEYLINKYGSQYGNDLNLLAEEQLADGFSDYYNGRLNGEDKVRLGTRLGIPQKVLAVYDRITEAIMGLVGKQDAIKQFYAQMETGKFRNEVFGNPEQLPAYKLDDDLSRILDHYKQSPRGGLDMNLVRQEYANNPEAIRHIDEVIAEVKQEAAQNKSRAQREKEYYTKLNNIANSFQPWQPNQGLNVNAIQDFHRAEYELAKEYPDIADNQAIIDTYEKNSALNNNTENIYHPDNQTDIDSIEAADIDPFEYTKEMTKEQKLARKGEQPTLKERWQDFKADMREKFVDRFAPIEDKIKNQSEQLEMRNAIDRTLRADGISEAFIRDNKFDKLITSFKNKKELQTFDQALIAKHALELEANGIETGRDIARDKALVKATNKRFAKEFKQVREYSDKVLQQTVDYGLISQDTANYLRKKYPDYVPFDRIFSDKEINTQMKHGVGAGEASLSKQDIVQRIKGSSRSIDSPLNALITKTQDMIQQGERNKTAELLASYAKDPKNPFQLRELKPDEVADGRPTISYLDNGTKRTFLAAPEVARAAKNMNREQMGIILRALAAPARLLRMGATTVNAGFTMANVVKDFVGATINSKGGFNSMNPKSIVSALGAAFHHNGDLYAEMQREGVLGNIYELTRNASDLNLNEIRSHKNTLTRSIHNAKSPLKTLENTIGRSEDFGRALQYVANKKYAKRKGMSESEAIKFAADQARWNSTNFLRSGTYGKAINAIVPYSNANIQGQRITLRRMKENPARYTGKIALGIVAPTVAAMALSYSNDENKKIMENLPDYVKENNVVVIGPGAKYNKEQNKWEGVYLVPVPPQFSPLHRQLHNMVRSAMTGQQFDTGKAVGDAVEQVTTVNPMEIRRTGAQYVPQAVKPFVETWANKNLYTGQEVVPEGMKNLDGKDQWDNSTSLTARKVGELTGLSPKQIDNAFRTSTAGGGQNLLHGMDFAIAKATGASDDEIKGRSMLDSVVGRFYAPKGTSQSSYFYQSLEKAAKDNKLSGSDLELYQALTSRKYNGDGNVEGKTEGDVLMNNRILANKPNIVKALSEAAKWRSAQTGEELDPLYKLPVDKQQYFYHLQGSPKNGAEQRKLKQDAPWLEDFQKERSAYFKRQDFKSGKSNRVPYPEVSDELQATLKTYHDMPSSPQKWAFLDAHPELSDHYKQIEDYNNKVREAQGYAPLRTRPQQSQYVKMQMANKNWRDPAVAKYLQDLNVYNITNSASLAEMQGEELSPKALKAIQSVGKYGLVKNPDGTFALKYPDGQGTNESHIQAGAVDMSSFGRRRGGRGGSSNGIRTSTDTLKLSNATALGMNAFKKNKSGLPQFSVKAIQKSGLLKSRRPTSRVVTFR